MDLLNEQLYNSTNRTYYHGSKYGIDKSVARYSCFYITLDFCYALGMSKLEDYSFGPVYKVKIKKKLNIFNTKSKNDKARLMDMLADVGDIRVKRDIYKDIENNDWAGIFKGDKQRDQIVDILKEIGYDGWFNYEFDKALQKQEKLSFYGITAAPCIGIFDTDCLDIEEIDLPNFFDFQKQKELDFQTLEIDATAAYYTDKDIYDTLMDNLDNMRHRKYLTLNEDDILDFVREFDPDGTSNNPKLEYAKKHHGFSGETLHGIEVWYWKE